AGAAGEGAGRLHPLRLPHAGHGRAGVPPAQHRARAAGKPHHGDGVPRHDAGDPRAQRGAHRALPHEALLAPRHGGRAASPACEARGRRGQGAGAREGLRRRGLIYFSVEAPARSRAAWSRTSAPLVVRRAKSRPTRTLSSSGMGWTRSISLPSTATVSVWSGALVQRTACGHASTTRSTPPLALAARGS